MAMLGVIHRSVLGKCPGQIRDYFRLASAAGHAFNYYNNYFTHIQRTFSGYRTLAIYHANCIFPQRFGHEYGRPPREIAEKHCTLPTRGLPRAGGGRYHAKLQERELPCAGGGGYHALDYENAGITMRKAFSGDNSVVTVQEGID